VLVKFTANWCGTCQYIERTVYQEPEVWQAMKDDDVTPLKVDLTNPDAPGKELLLTLNPSGGIPLTAIWVPGSNEPIQLASVYGTGELLKALQQVK
jgi:thiol:disulfide interchange protein DsbD